MRGIAKLQGEILRLAPDHIGLGDRSQSELEGVQTALFLQATANPANTWKGGQRLGGGINIGGLAVIDEQNPLVLAHHLAAMRQARIAVKGLLDHFGRNPQSTHGRIGATGILVIMRAGQARDGAQIDRACLPPFAIFRQPAFAREHIPSHTRQLLPRGDADHPPVCRTHR